MLKYLTLYFPPLALAPIRLSLATTLLFPVVLYKEGLVIPPIATFLPIAGVATFSIYLHQITLSWGISQTSSTHASLILGLNPLLTTVLATYLMKENFSFGKGLGILLGFSGVALVVSSGTAGASTLTGDLVMFAATITFVIGSLFVKKSTKNLSPLIVTAYSHGLASIGLLCTGGLFNSIWTYPGAFEPLPIIVLLFSSFINTALGALWWNTGIQQVGAATASLFLNATPVFGVFAAALFLGEQLNWTHFVALLLVITGVSLGTGLIGGKQSPSR
jgi:drug/metabolite transporter (DMT)-like permease